jgi:hypothetical protein
MKLKTYCEHCGRLVLGIFMTLEKASGKYLCSFCAAKEKVNAKNPHLGKCRDCDEWVSIGAVRCPNCGADLRVRI